MHWLLSVSAKGEDLRTNGDPMDGVRHRDRMEIRQRSALQEVAQCSHYSLLTADDISNGFVLQVFQDERRGLIEQMMVHALKPRLSCGIVISPLYGVGNL